MDQRRAENFAGRMMAALNDGALCLMLSIGHRTGLLDVLREQRGEIFGLSHGSLPL